MAQYDERRTLRREWIWFLIKLFFLIVSMLAIASAIVGGIWLGWKVITLSPGLPTVAQLTKKQPTSSIVRDRNGLKICEAGNVKHEHIAISDIPKTVINAVVAAEDQRFFSHGGIDYIGVVRAGFKALAKGHLSQGGSTITQQVAKNYLLTREKTFDRKVKEAIIAKRIEEKFGKGEILELYLNKVNYGYGRYGIETASKFYFGHSIREASLAEVALLVGIHPSPGRYNPRKNMDKAKGRQKYVLARMLAEKMISAAEYKAAVDEEIKIVSDRPEEAKTGQEVCDEVNARLKKLFDNDEEAISQLGWEIPTEVDIRVQAASKEALENGIGRIVARNHLKDRPQGAVVVMNPERGVITMVGGAPYKPGELDRALYALRQPGSAFKGFVYAAGFEAHRFGVNDIFMNSVTEFYDHGRTWAPGNYRGEASETPFFSVKDAFAHSLNTIAVKAICGLGVNVQVGSEDMVGGLIKKEYCASHGLVSETIALSELAGIKWSYQEKKELNPSIALGSHNVTPIGLLGAYMAIAYDGKFVQPKIITKIVGENAPSLPEQEVRDVVSPETKNKMRVLTLAVVEEGTGRKANGKLPQTVYGKTGTTNNSTNAWFVCFDDDYAAVVYIGFDMQSRSIGRDETGASAALPVCIDALRAAHNLEGSMVKSMRQQPKRETEAEETPLAEPASETQPLTDTTKGDEPYQPPTE